MTELWKNVPEPSALRALAVALVGMAVLFGVTSSSASAWGFPNQQIADQARSYPIGSWQGQCKVFAKNVVNGVLGANGIGARVGGYGSPGGAYYGAYQNAGGTLVGVSNGEPGDLIQTISPNYVHSDSPPISGLHTAIIVGRTSPGSYIVRDSNWTLNETVQEHAWSPASWAASRGAAAYIWRFGQLASPPPPPPPDQDGDGVPDGSDACKDVKGDQVTGCPSAVGVPFDANGDGKTDLVHRWSNGVNTWLSAGDGGYVVKTQQAHPGYGYENGVWFASDANGDGKTDLVHRWSNGVNTWLSAGDGGYVVKTQQAHPGYGYGDGQWPASIHSIRLIRALLPSSSIPALSDPSAKPSVAPNAATLSCASRDRTRKKIQRRIKALIRRLRASRSEKKKLATKRLIKYQRKRLKRLKALACAER